jgi:hypothetical protein
MISNLKGRILAITAITIAIHVLFHGIHSDGFTNTYYTISMVVYSIWIIFTIESHIDTEVCKGVHKIVDEFESLRGINSND